jgi:hypothetical protein
MKAFLGRNCFAGATTSYTGPFLSQASFAGCVAFSNWPRVDVERLLPAELELAVNISETPDAHPVVFIFGEVAEGATILAGFAVPLGVRYAEFALAIPFVTHKDGRSLHTYIPRMYSSHFPATWTGNALYGFAKEMAKMWWQGPVFMLTREDDTLLLHAAIESQCDWSSGPRCTLPNFEAMRSAFALPIVGRKVDGAYVCSYFDWSFSEARVRAADSCVAIDAPIIDGLTPRRCYGVRAGTFQVERMLWRLSWPFPCHFR